MPILRELDSISTQLPSVGQWKISEGLNSRDGGTPLKMMRQRCRERGLVWSKCIKTTANS